jgi:hypothetical protein
MKAFAGHAPEYPALQLVFPSRQRVEAVLPPGVCGRRGRGHVHDMCRALFVPTPAGLGFLCFTEGNWPTPARWYLHHLRPACSNRQGVVEHTKLMVREVYVRSSSRYRSPALFRGHYTRPCRAVQADDGMGYIYAGSHNLSTFAWGQMGKRGGESVVTYRNYEVGVLLCPVRYSFLRCVRHGGLI